MFYQYTYNSYSCL